MTDIYEQIFGKVAIGGQYTGQNKIGGGYNSSSLTSSMNKFRNFIYGGNAGRNLSKANADLIISVIEPHLKNLPLGGKLDYSTKMSMKEKLYQYELAGKLSQQDFEDAKHIVELF